jgi:hypothetical protein
MSEFSKRATWMAAHSEDGDRLLEITREHLAIARDLSENRQYITEQDREILTARITELRLERDAILAKYEALLKEHEAEVGEVVKP